MGVLSLISILVVAGFLALLALRLVPVYAESFEVKAIISQVQQELSGKEVGRTEIQQAILRRFSLNNVTGVNRDDFVFRQTRNGLSLEVNYEVRMALLYNLDLVASFSEEALFEQ